MTRVYVADAKSEVRSALRLLLADLKMQVVGEAKDWPTTRAGVPTTNPDMLVLEWELPVGFSAALADLRLACPNLRIVVISNQLEARQAAISAGADAFISKGDGADRVTERLRDAANGNTMK
jgi:DNA-binding NarL/FixJ family response regulator